jgi:hypothetical protein
VHGPALFIVCLRTLLLNCNLQEHGAIGFSSVQSVGAAGGQHVDELEPSKQDASNSQLGGCGGLRTDTAGVHRDGFTGETLDWA